MPRAHIVSGLGYGDEGKGSIVDYLVRKTRASLVVRHNGGAQAAHNVVTPDGRHHTFSQWGAGTLAGAATFLSRYVITHPIAMVNEATHLRSLGVSDPWGLLIVDARALVITPYHQWANRAREEKRGTARHGSCGMGVGEAYVDRGEAHALRFGELQDRKVVRAKLMATREAKRHLGDPDAEIWDQRTLDHAVDVFADVGGRALILPAGLEGELLANRPNVVFEGAQGVLLDEYRGVQPWTTWSNTTSENALDILGGLDFQITKIGVLRAYVSRHGPGPLRTYDEGLTARLQDEHNRWNPWQQAFRCGWFDAPLAREAIAIEGGIDRLALTNVDRLAGLAPIHIAGMDRDVGVTASSIIGAIEAECGHRVSLVSHGPTANDKEER